MIGRIILLVGGIWGSVLIGQAGNEMNDLQSVSGTSVAEYYYQSMGNALIGLAVIFGILCVGLALKDIDWHRFDDSDKPEQTSIDD